MEAVRDAVIIVHVRLAALHEVQAPLIESEYETEEYDLELGSEDVASLREFPSQTGRCPLVERLRTLVVRCLPSPALPSCWKTLFVVWMVWCGVLRNTVPLLLGTERFAALEHAFLQLTV